MKSLQLTTKSWMLGFGTNDPGLLFEIDERFLYLSITKRLEFASFDKAIAKFGDMIVDDPLLEQPKISYIGSFPVKHPNAVIISVDPPLYTKGGNTLFAAGYWGLFYPTGWTLTFCPKQDTIKANTAIGPFSDRLEAFNQINSMKNQRIT